MEKLTSFKQIEEVFKNNGFIYFIDKGQCYTLKPLALHPFYPKLIGEKWILLHKLTDKIISVKESDLINYQYFIGKYDGDFLEKEIIAYYQSKINFSLSLINNI